MVEKHRYRRQLVVNSASTIAGSVWAMVVGIVTLPLLLKGLGAVGTGTWVLLQTFSVSSGWLSLADLGVGQAATKAIAEHASLDEHDARKRAVGTAIALFVALGIGFGALFLLLGYPLLPHLFRTPSAIRGQLRAAIVFFSAQVVFDLATQAPQSALEGLQRLDLSRLDDALRRTVTAVAVCTAAVVSGNLATVAAASLVASIAGTLLSFGLLWMTDHHPLGRPSARVARGLAGYGFRIGALNGIGVVFRTMNRLIVGAILGPAAVALVEVASQVQSGAGALLSASSYPAFSAAPWLSSRGDHERVRELVLRATRYSLLVTVPLTAALMTLARPLVRVWVGSAYRDATGLVVIALLYVLLAAPLAVASNVLQGVGLAGKVLRATGLALAVNLVLSLVLVHVTGVVGVFQATVLSMIVLVPLLAAVVRTHLQVPVGALLRHAILPALPPAAVVAGVCAVAQLLFGSGELALGAGAAASLVLGAAVAMRFSVRRGEMRELVDLVRAPS